MNTCHICQGDGVLLIGNRWYCVEHVDDGFIQAARLVARASGDDEEKAATQAAAFLDYMRSEP